MWLIDYYFAVAVPVQLVAAPAAAVVALAEFAGFVGQQRLPVAVRSAVAARLAEPAVALAAAVAGLHLPEPAVPLAEPVVPVALLVAVVVAVGSVVPFQITSS
ncbi:hypothetical protein [Lentibacillus persicus]|uniref:hypothetical protein n=1 Tax=Lentibacillus persicus TaxID=640948 RepID=UPI001C42F3D1|nr:hypothetical protein [Lentibacillus persicus]